MKQVESLFVAEFPVQHPASGGSALSSVFSTKIPLFEILTCQRSLAIGFGKGLEAHPRLKRHFRGIDAYQYLLQFTCGLESEIKGETDVFGQTKTAVRNFLEHPDVDPLFANEIETLFLKIFEDTKEIRCQYLHGIGGNTYGALSRKILNPSPQDRVLIIGAGQMSKSIAPYFAEFKLKLWNRSLERLLSLKDELEAKSSNPVEAITGTNELVRALQDATIVILATPSGSEVDALLKQTQAQKILHLGGQLPDIQDLALSANLKDRLWSLSDLFLIEKQQSAIREKQVHQAVNACKQRATLRSLARSIHISHGWEDLALFN